MIKFIDLEQKEPFQKFKDFYDDAVEANQILVQAISISSFSNTKNEVDSRFVNLKAIKGKEFIFFSNYNSPKSEQFSEHNQISAVFFWNSINVQIRMKGLIKKTSNEFNKEYFSNREFSKNALAISSNQSMPIDSYKRVISNYNKVLSNSDLKECPDYWGGYSFSPYNFEFWQGHENRLNLRELYELENDRWIKKILQP